MIPRQSTDEEDTAYHEAGHAVVGAAGGRAPIFVTIIPDGGAAGKNEFPKDGRPEFKSHFGDSPEKRAYIETRILIEVAGTIAHDLRFPERGHDAGDANDERCARALIEENAGWADNDRDSYLEQLKKTARGLLQANWPWVEAVARALIERKTISTEEVMKLRPSG
jgi:ATP-dependent Zn protease